MEQGEKEPLHGIDPNALHLAWLNEEYEEETKSAPDEMNLITPYFNNSFLAFHLPVAKRKPRKPAKKHTTTILAGKTLFLHHLQNTLLRLHPINEERWFTYDPSYKMNPCFPNVFFTRLLGIRLRTLVCTLGFYFAFFPRFLYRVIMPGPRPFAIFSFYL